MSCPRCCEAVLVEIAADVTGKRLTMHSCPSCEARWWDCNGETVDLGRMLDAVAAD